MGRERERTREGERIEGEVSVFLERCVREVDVFSEAVGKRGGGEVLARHPLHANKPHPCPPSTPLKHRPARSARCRFKVTRRCANLHLTISRMTRMCDGCLVSTRSEVLLAMPSPLHTSDRLSGACPFFCPDIGHAPHRNGRIASGRPVPRNTDADKNRGRPAHGFSMDLLWNETVLHRNRSYPRRKRFWLPWSGSSLAGRGSVQMDRNRKIFRNKFLLNLVYIYY